MKFEIIVDSIVVGIFCDGVKVFKVVKELKGIWLSVLDWEIFEVIFLLVIFIGVFVELVGAVVMVGLLKLVRKGKMFR